MAKYLQREIGAVTLVIKGCQYCGMADRVLSQVEGKWVCAFCKPLLLEVNPVYRFIGKGLDLIESGLGRVHDKLSNLPIVVSVSNQIIAQFFDLTLAFTEATRRTVRLYLVEGQHLSIKGGEQKRLTWYTHPRLAREMCEHTKLTGRLVYVDLELTCVSPYSHRFYKHDFEAYILQEELLKTSKRKWKYYKEELWTSSLEDTQNMNI
jgi:hypothetical protein